VLLAIPLGVIAALKQDTWVDYAVRIFSIAGIATPSFWLGIVVILALLIVFKWLPPMVYTPPWVNPWQNLAQLIWPALAVGYRYSAVATRMTRSAMLEVLREDYIRTARAKGLWEKLILTRHALKNAMLPVLTVVGLEFAFLMGGLVVTEQVFNLNGLGLLFVQSVAHRDYTLTQALVLLVAAIFIVVNFLMDLMYAWLDPRIRSVDGLRAPSPCSRCRRATGLAPRSALLCGSHWAIGAVVVVNIPRRFAPVIAPYDPAPTTAMLSPRRTLAPPTLSAATCSRASSTARAPRSWWASALRSWGPPSARSSAWAAPTSAGWSISTCSASWTSSSRFP
jgi:ABC-type dipeptide/oligopeptide/nickel transport system permease subunit